MPEVNPRAASLRRNQPGARRPSTRPINEPPPISENDDASATGETPTSAVDPAVVGVSTEDQALMRARLAMMATPRDSDSPSMAALRAILRDTALMTHVTANVEQWPPLSDEQRETLDALLQRSARRLARPAARRAARRRAA